MPIKNLNNQNCELVSECCGAKMITHCSDEGTGHYSCNECGAACDGKVEIAMGVSQWKIHGQRFGYWDYFLDLYKQQTKVGALRQWLNENRIDDVKKMVSDEEILKWLEL